MSRVQLKLFCQKEKFNKSNFLSAQRKGEPVPLVWTKQLFVNAVELWPYIVLLLHLQILGYFTQGALIRFCAFFYIVLDKYP